jgi:hypothetical protein
MHPPLESKNMTSKRPEEVDLKVFNTFIKQRTTVAIHLTHSIK